MLSTMEQVAAAFGAALAVTVMSARRNALMTDGADRVGAQLDGMQLSFLVTAVLALIMVIVAVLPSRTVTSGEVEGSENRNTEAIGD